MNSWWKITHILNSSQWTWDLSSYVLGFYFKEAKTKCVGKAERICVSECRRSKCEPHTKAAFSCTKVTLTLIVGAHAIFVCSTRQLPSDSTALAVTLAITVTVTVTVTLSFCVELDNCRQIRQLFTDTVRVTTHMSRSRSLQKWWWF